MPITVWDPCAMRATKAYVASIGTTGLLVASSVVLLAVVTALVAFRGGAPGDLSDEVGRMLIGGDRQFSLAAAASESADRDSPGEARSDRRAVRTDGRSGVSRLAPRSGDPFIDQLGVTRRQSSGGSGADDTTVATPEEPAGGSQIQQVKDDARNIVQDQTRTVGETVGQVNPDLGKTVTETGEKASEVIGSVPDPTGP